MKFSQRLFTRQKKSRIQLAKAEYFLFFLILLLIPPLYATTDVWDVLREELIMDHQLNRPEVQQQIRWILAHPGYLQSACKQSEPYIYHILGKIKKRKLPGELALLPMIESAYNPFAHSIKGAAGLWQIMPGTGNAYGLTQDWWFDGRRSIASSTDAALNYLVYLRKFFNGNWIFAIAAYDAGEGTIDKAIKLLINAQKPVYFWHLSLSNETKVYVPRLLALAEIIKNAEIYHVQLPAIPYLPYFEEVNIGGQMDLNHAAHLAGISYKELIQLNPGFNRWATAPNKAFSLLLPIEKVAQFYENISQMFTKGQSNWAKPSPSPSQPVLRPQKLAYAPPVVHKIIFAKNVRVIHIVQPHDSYKKLEKIYRVTKKAIQFWNNLEASQPLFPGQQLIIWKTTNPADSEVKKA